MTTPVTSKHILTLAAWIVALTLSVILNGIGNYQQSKQIHALQEDFDQTWHYHSGFEQKIHSITIITNQP